MGSQKAVTKNGGEPFYIGLQNQPIVDTFICGPSSAVVTYRNVMPGHQRPSAGKRGELIRERQEVQSYLRDFRRAWANLPPELKDRDLALEWLKSIEQELRDSTEEDHGRVAAETDRLPLRPTVRYPEREREMKTSDAGFRPRSALDSVDDADREACRVRADRGILLSAFIAVFNEDLDHVLLVKLGKYAWDRYRGYPWTLPGGSVWDDEAPSDGAMRELQEETGITIEPGTLRLAGWFPRPHHKPWHRERRGELLLLYAALGNPDDERLNPPIQQPGEDAEILEALFAPYSLDAFLAVPEQGSDEHPLQPMPRHWKYWCAVARHALSRQLDPPLVHVYTSQEAMKLPPWLPERAGAFVEPRSS